MRVNTASGHNNDSHEISLFRFPLVMIRSTLLLILAALSLASQPREATRIPHSILLTKNIDTPEAFIAATTSDFDYSSPIIIHQSEITDSETVVINDEDISKAVVAHNEVSDSLPVATICPRADWRDMTIHDDMQLGSRRFSHEALFSYFSYSNPLCKERLFVYVFAAAIIVRDVVYDNGRLGIFSLMVMILESLENLYTTRKHLPLAPPMTAWLKSLCPSFALLLLTIIAASISNSFPVYILLRSQLEKDRLRLGNLIIVALGIVSRDTRMFRRVQQSVNSARLM